MFSGFLTAFRTLCILPLPGKDVAKFSRSLPWFPLVGLLLGGMTLALFSLLQPLFSPEVTALFLLIFITLLTGGLHLDGLADWADGIFGGQTKERRLEIMKDSNLGSFAGIALGLLFFSKWVALVELSKHPAGMALLLAFLFSRSGMAALAAFYPYARKEGTAYSFIAQAKPWQGLVALGLAASLALLLVGPWGLVPLGASLLFMGIFGAWMKVKVGGITGDLLGSYNELTETGLLLGLALFPCQFSAGYLSQWGLL